MKQSVESILTGFKSQLSSYIRSRVSDRYAAEDILQEVFVKLCDNAGHLGNASSLKAWLYKVTHNTIVDHYRKKNPGLVPIDEVAEGLGGEEESTNMNEETTACLRGLISGLSSKYREPFELHVLDNLKHKEIAAKLDMTISGSKTRVQRAKDRLRQAAMACCEFEFDRRGNVIEYRPKKNRKNTCG